MILYNKKDYSNLRFKFKDAEKIERNYSQAYQDIFVLSCLNGKTNGTFLEIGGHQGEFINNTFLLEKDFEWYGISVEIDVNLIHTFRNRPKTKFIGKDALKIDYEFLLKENNFPPQIDYLQIDIEPQYNTLTCLKRLPLDKYRFSVITYETDFYDTAVTKEESLKNREESRNILKSFGYELIVGNICNVSTQDPFEDWYVDPKIIPQEIIQKMKDSDEFNNTSERYMLKNKFENAIN